MKRLLLAAVLATLVAAPARAQDDHLFHVNIGGGFTNPVNSDMRDHFSTGGNFTIGAEINPQPMFGFQVEYGYNGLSGKDKRLPSVNPLTNEVIAGNGPLIESHHAMHYVDFNGTVRAAGDHAVKPYGIGGFGMYYRSISLTTPDVGFTTICDPWWYVCYPAAVEVDRIVGDRHSWDPGINLGGGVGFRLGDAATFYVETRWHYMWGPEFTNAAGESQKANGQYFPVTFGFRF